MLDLCRKKAKLLNLKPTLYEQYLETLSLPRRYKTILIPSSTMQLIIEPALVKESLNRLYDHLLPGGVVVSPIMTLWKTGDPLITESEKTAVREEDGAEFRRVSWVRYEPETECEHTEDRYQLIVAGEVVAEEVHQRSPATRSYDQAQARKLFEDVGFSSVSIYSEFSFEPVKADDTLFSVVAQKMDRP